MELKASAGCMRGVRPFFFSFLQRRVLHICTDSQMGLREREQEEAAKKEEARQARLFEAEAEAERSKAMKEASSFGGCYSALASTVLNLLPQKVPPSHP